MTDAEKKELALLENRARAGVATWDDGLRIGCLRRKQVDADFAEGKPAHRNYVRLDPW